MKKEDMILKSLVAWLIGLMLVFNAGAIVAIIALLEYTLWVTLPLVIIVVSLTALLDIVVTLMLLETKEEWK